MSSSKGNTFSRLASIWTSERSKISFLRYRNKTVSYLRQLDWIISINRTILGSMDVVLSLNKALPALYRRLLYANIFISYNSNCQPECDFYQNMKFPWCLWLTHSYSSRYDAFQLVVIFVFGFGAKFKLILYVIWYSNFDMLLSGKPNKS